MADEQFTVPLGHYIQAHHLFGFCASCRNKTYYDELSSWRIWSLSIPEISDVVRQIQEGKS